MAALAGLAEIADRRAQRVGAVAGGRGQRVDGLRVILAVFGDFRVSVPDLGQRGGLAGVGFVVRTRRPGAAIVEVEQDLQIAGELARQRRVVFDLALGHAEQRAGVERAQLHLALAGLDCFFVGVLIRIAGRDEREAGQQQADSGVDAHV